MRRLWDDAATQIIHVDKCMLSVTSTILTHRPSPTLLHVPSLSTGQRSVQHRLEFQVGTSLSSFAGKVVMKQTTLIVDLIEKSKLN